MGWSEEAIQGAETDFQNRGLIEHNRLTTMQLRHRFTPARDWILAACPVLLTTAGGALFFGRAIVDSIQSTPHPALVYVIFGTLLIAVLGAWAVLFQLHRDERSAQAWDRLDTPAFESALRAVHRGSPFLDAYALVAKRDRRSSDDDRRELERRLHAGERTYGERLAFPGFIAGALVGLGLVGTFIGLLGALNELAQLFTGMTAGSGSDPAAMLGGMMVKLQAPMKSMGTAFIASLYGLLGSLLLGLTLVAVQKTRHRVAGQVHDVLIDAFDRDARGALALPRLPGESEAEHARWQAVLGGIELLRDAQARALDEALAPIAQVESSIARLAAIVAAALDRAPVFLDQGAQLRELMARLCSLQESGSRELVHALQSQQQASQRLVELGVLSQEADQAAAARRDHRDAALQQSLQDCRDAFDDISGRLRTVLLDAGLPARA